MGCTSCPVPEDATRGSISCPLQVRPHHGHRLWQNHHHSTLSIAVADLAVPLVPDTDESCTLSLSSGAAILTAATAWGAIHGLETLSELASGSHPTVVPTGVSISDRPLFSHRGLLLDTSRNFYPVGNILRTIRAMGYNKMNVFHWHITDAQSFPLQLPSTPELAARGSYGTEMTYSPADVKRVMEYAMRRAVRVIPEIDAPGSWTSRGDVDDARVEISLIFSSKMILASVSFICTGSSRSTSATRSIRRSSSISLQAVAQAGFFFFFFSSRLRVQLATPSQAQRSPRLRYQL